MGPGPRTVITVANLKGGTSKTTTAAFVAHALYELGARVLAVDADPQASLYVWHQANGFPFPAVAMPSARLHREIPGVAGDMYDVVVVDTPPTEHDKGITLSAIRAATHVLVPVAPTPPEYQRLPAMRSLLDDAADLEATPRVAVLLVRTVANAISTRTYRAAIAEDGWHVLRPTVARLEDYAQAMGVPIERAAASGYADALDELMSP
jgi:chromosome partitioning protein